MKKLLAAAAGVLMCASAVFAGGAKEAPKASGPVTLKWVLWDWDATAYYKPLIEAYEAKNPNVKIEYLDLGSSEYQTMLGIQLTGGDDSIDVVTVKDIPGYNTLQKAGHLVDLTSYIKSSGIDTAQYGGTTEQITVNNALYALPFRSDFWVVYYNNSTTLLHAK